MARHAGASERRRGDKPGLAARAAAVALVSSVLDEGQLLNAVLDAPDGPLKGLAGDDRARAQRLALAVLRRLDRADAVLAPHLRKAPPAMVQHVLRLATVELCQYGAAAHGVVDSSVELVRRNRKTANLGGLVNAVLRKVAAEGPGVWPTLSPQRMPGWLRRPLTGAYGKAVVRRIEAVQESEPPVDLTPRGDAAVLAARIERAEVLPTGSVRIPSGARVSALPGYLSGDFWVQDAAAALPARILGVRPGDRVLDICAAPGGKTLQLAAAGAEVTALDISERRLARLQENLARTSLKARVVAADALEWQDDPFDAILLDAPCSATGTIRRHPDLPHVKTAADVEDLVELQARLIDRAAGLLKPGGRIVFCTCSLLPEEGEGQARAALERLPDLALDPSAFDHDWIDAAWRVPEGLRLRPDHWADRGGIDGFFITTFRKSGHDSGRRAP